MRNMVSIGDKKSMNASYYLHYYDIYDLLICLHKIRFQHG